MSIVDGLQAFPASAQRLPLLAATEGGRVLAWRDGRAVRADVFLAHVQTMARQLPDARHAVNLCEDRYAFLVAFCAVLLAGQTNLLPPSRAPQAVDEVMDSHPGCYALGEQDLALAPPHYLHLPGLLDTRVKVHGFEVPMLAATHVAAIGYTSGSTGQPRPSIKTWGSFRASNDGNLAMLQRAVGARFNVVATVPPQHMYGMEMSVLLPLLGAIGVHAGRPFFPADVARALAQMPAPRVLVTTPVHLRALVQDGGALPPLAAMVSATAPMPTDLAMQAEQRFDAPLLEVFGSTETCVFASRRSSCESSWSPYPGVRLQPQPDGTAIEAPQLDAAVILADIIELRGPHGFRLCGRNTDLLEIAGKRASLGDLTRRLLAIDGVRDAVVCQLDAADAMGIRRIAALVEAPDLREAQILDSLRRSIDPVFLPRPLRKVARLPRNEAGKLPRQALLDLLHMAPAASADAPCVPPASGC